MKKAGITCAVCSHWEIIDGKNTRVQVTHPTIAAVKLCNYKHNAAKKAVVNKATAIKGPWQEDAMWTPDVEAHES